MFGFSFRVVLPRSYNSDKKVINVGYDLLNSYSLRFIRSYFTLSLSVVIMLK